MIEATERARVGPGLGMCSKVMLRCRRSMETRVSAVESSSTTKSTGMIEVVTIDKDSAVGNVGVVVENDSVVMPVVSPVVPAPTEAAKEADSKAKAKRHSRAGKEQSWVGIPAGPYSDWFPIDDPRVVLRHVDNLRVRGLDHNRLSLFAHLFLRCALQVSCRLRTIAHYLNSIHHVLLLVDVSIA